jgi:hypothetical protein
MEKVRSTVIVIASSPISVGEFQTIARLIAAAPLPGKACRAFGLRPPDEPAMNAILHRARDHYGTVHRFFTMADRNIARNLFSGRVVNAERGQND